jgi:proline iminopeptidase
LSCPADHAWLLAQRWPDVDLVLNADSGHGGSPAASTLVLEAVDRFSS